MASAVAVTEIVAAPAATTAVVVAIAPVAAIAASAVAASCAVAASLIVACLSAVAAAFAVVAVFEAVASPVAFAAFAVVTAVNWEGLFLRSCCRDRLPGGCGSVMHTELETHGDRLQMHYGGRLRFGPDPTFDSA